jgi:predicted component of type VI protein secretion system
MNSIKKPIQKDSAFETEVIERLDCLQRSNAKTRQGLREIVREEIKNVLNERNKKSWWQMA